MLPTLLLIAMGLALGSVIGLVVARRVAMTGMPQLIAVLNGLVGLAAVLVGYNSYVSPDACPPRWVPSTWERSSWACSSVG